MEVNNVMPHGIVLSQGNEANVSDYRVTSDRFVVYLDIMGFKDRIARNSHDKVLETLTIFTNLISNIKEQDKYRTIQQSQFSDSIILFSKSNTTDDLYVISEMTKEIVRIAVKNEIPIRGSLAQGKLTVDPKKSIFFGQPLVDAYELEEKGVKYYGVVVHNSAESIIKVCPDGNKLFKDIKTPLKYGWISHYELSWYFDDIEQTMSVLNKIRENVSGEPRVYVDNTLKVLEDNYFSKKRKKTEKKQRET